MGLAWMLAGQTILVTWRGSEFGEKSRSKGRNMTKFWGDDENGMMKYNYLHVFTSFFGCGGKYLHIKIEKSI